MPAKMISRRRLLGSGLAISLFDCSARGEPAAGQDGSLILEAAPGSLRLLPEPAAPTPVLAFNGAVPGPLLRCKKGEELKIRLVNGLEQPTSLSWPGVRIVNGMDGVGGLTQKPVAPGESFDYRFTPPDSGLFGYRPAVLPFAGEQFGRGLYGALIVDEPDPPKADRDMLAVIADWRLDDKGAIIADFDAKEDAAGRGRVGSLVTLNSTAVPVAETMPPGSRVRLRLLSAVNARIMSIAFEGLKPLILAVDGQPADSAFEPVRQTIPVGPGARFDMMFDLPEEAAAQARLILRGDNEPDRVLLSFRTEGEARKSLPAIGSLPVNPSLPAEIRLQNAKRAELVIEPAKQASAEGTQPLYWTINGVAAAAFSAKPLFSVKRGSPVTLAIVNRSAFIQDIHVHGHSMRLLHDLDDGWEPYWRDSVLVPAGKTKHLAFIADNPGKWAIESAIAERQATGLSAWFLVT
ncbi:Multicopper oxidase type 3 [Methylocella tundrae]|uniref:Multicopper oxidase type 3 n=2 Tax=Methylocella tundrae TaxID=227605 RepID=A0A8B6M0V6_METTU|nr:Multicopper oxidase type 3 [Methylocella tundrae]VTZ48364.1 Multicopper oxidase type 3 [Methylocella tundrae]